MQKKWEKKRKRFFDIRFCPEAWPRQRPDFRFSWKAQEKKTEDLLINPFLPGNFFPHCTALLDLIIKKTVAVATAVAAEISAFISATVPL